MYRFGLVWKAEFMEIFDCQEDAGRAEGISAALSAVAELHLVVIPTDTAYALGGDAFSSAATSRIRSIKGMADETPLQVLINSAAVLDGVASPASQQARLLADTFWPGPLTIIVPASPTVLWEVGGNTHLVQLRVPDHPVAMELLQLTGPLAISAARTTRSSIIESVEDATDLQHHVAVFLNSGVIKPAVLSTIVDCTSEDVAILRKGSITVGQLVDVLGYMPRVPAV